MSTPEIRLDLGNPREPLVTVTGLSRGDLAALSRANLTRAAWASVLRIGVSAGAPPVAGAYTVANGTIRFTPMFPLEPGRAYTALFDPAAVPGGALQGVAQISRVLSIPADASSAPVTVAAVYPTADTVPANLLRMYVEFSGPMGSRGGQDYITLTNARGEPLSDALLPLDTPLWNADHTRFTVLFDPGRVKRGILPNRRMGRPLAPGESFTLIVGAGWPDAHGVPGASAFRREYRIGAPIERALDPGAWTLSRPAAGSRDPLAVDFPWALDRALLQRTLSIARGDGTVPGDVAVRAGERQWVFTPRSAWQAGNYALVAQPELEDASGNRVGHAFETGASDSDDGRATPARVGFVVRER